MMDDRQRCVLSIDFGSVLHERVLDISNSLEIPKSELVRSAVEHFLDGEYYHILKNSKEQKNQVKTTKREEVYRIVTVYNSVFYGNATPPSQFYPALYKVYNAAVKGGLSTNDMIALIEASPNETFVQQELRAGKTPSLPYLLSQGMIPRLMVCLHDTSAKTEKLSEAEFIEYQYDVLDEYAGRVEYDRLDNFREDVMSAKNKNELKRLLNEYIG